MITLDDILVFIHYSYIRLINRHISVRFGKSSNYAMLLSVANNRSTVCIDKMVYSDYLFSRQTAICMIADIS